MPVKAGGRAAVLGLPVDALSMSAAVDRCEALCLGPATQNCAVVITLNVEMTMSARKDPALREFISDAELVVPDSVGIQKAAGLAERVPGIELLVEVMKKAGSRGGSVYLLGAAPGVAEDAAGRLQELAPGLRIAGVRDGYWGSQGVSDDEVVAQISAAAPDYLFVALGAGRQESWIQTNRARLGAKVAMGVGGSFDVISGRAKRAPEWARRANLEWFYRVALSPSRWGRAMALPHFAVTVVADRVFRKVTGKR